MLTTTYTKISKNCDTIENDEYTIQIHQAKLDIDNGNGTDDILTANSLQSMIAFLYKTSPKAPYDITITIRIKVNQIKIQQRSTDLYEFLFGSPDGITKSVSNRYIDRKILLACERFLGTILYGLGDNYYYNEYPEIAYFITSELNALYNTEASFDSDTLCRSIVSVINNALILTNSAESANGYLEIAEIFGYMINNNYTLHADTAIFKYITQLVDRYALNQNCKFDIEEFETTAFITWNSLSRNATDYLEYLANHNIIRTPKELIRLRIELYYELINTYIRNKKIKSVFQPTRVYYHDLSLVSELGLYIKVFQIPYSDIKDRLPKWFAFYLKMKFYR